MDTPVSNGHHPGAEGGKVELNGNLNNNHTNGYHALSNGSHNGDGGGGQPANGNGYHQNEDDDDEQDALFHQLNSEPPATRKSLMKMNLQNVETFVKVNSPNNTEREITWAKADSPVPTFLQPNSDPEQQKQDTELQQAVQKAFQDISHAAANGVQGEAIIFKAEDGKAPPITMTILKKNSSGEQVAVGLPGGEEQGNSSNKEQDPQTKRNSFINPNFIGDISKRADNNASSSSSSTSSSPSSPTFLSSTSNGTTVNGSSALPPPAPALNQQHKAVNFNDVPILVEEPENEQENPLSRHHQHHSSIPLPMNNYGATPGLKSEAFPGLNRPDINANDNKSYPNSSSASRMIQHEKLHVVAKRKQEERRLQFEKLQSTYKLDVDAQRVTSLGWETLVTELQERKLTAKQALSAYIAKSLEATAFCNAVTEYNPRSMEIAEELDRMSTVKGPLHGVPFCVKDDTDLEGMDSTLGYVKHCYQPASKSAALVQTLVELGGVPFCKTNVPQTLLNYASDNPVFGTTTSSHNQKLGPGGSSSGTGALVGAFGSMFGTGTDIGGSLRIPAHFNGVSSLKPTAGRLSCRGVSAVLPNIMGLDATTGIIGRNANIVSSVFKHLLQDNVHTKYDPKIPPIPWNEEIHSSKRKLRIGYFTQVPYFPPVGDTIQVVENAVEALKSQGHTLVPMEIPDGARLMRCATNFLLADNSLKLKALWKGEEVAKSAELNRLAARCPAWVLKLAGYLMHRKMLSFLYSPALGSILDCGSFKSHQLWENTGEQKVLCEEMFSTWANLELDCCICPVMPFPAIPVYMPGMLPVAAIYTMTWNVVNFPAGVVKFGVESGKNIDSYDNRGDQALKMAQQACKESIGSPIGVQVVGLPFKEELVLRVMEELDTYAGEHKTLTK